MIRDDEERLKKYYTESYLKNNYWQPFNPVPNLYSRKQRQIIRNFLMTHGVVQPKDLWEKTVLDAGCGSGGTLMTLLELGMDPQKATGIDLLSGRIDEARHKCPSIDWRVGSLLDATLTNSYDIVIVFAVLSSILDNALRQQFMEAACCHVVEGGIVLFYDLVTPEPQRLSADYTTVGHEQLMAYFSAFHTREIKRAYLRQGIASIMLRVVNLPLVELLQELRIFNSPSTFLLATRR